jgi:two-component system OmpR family sensor kinase/two-component system sensor histidine kinase BaeS
VTLPLLAIAVAISAQREITRPLADVMQAADSVADGDLSVRVDESTRGEFARLTFTFNRMIAELQRAEEQRRNLTADVAHELRTPLHIIQGNLEGVLDGVYQPTTEHITALLEETHRLARLVEDLRTLSLAESGHLPLRIESALVSDLLSDVVTSFSGQAESARIKLEIETEVGLGTMQMPCDVGRLNQVLANLIANALRYTPAGGVVTLRAVSILEGIQFQVKDTGEGIPEADLPYVFDRFWKGDPSRTSIEGAGSGLGLAIARQLVQLHGGEIEVKSVVGRGTTFTINLPLIYEPDEDSNRTQE